MNAFIMTSVPVRPLLRWVVAAPGEGLVQWEQIVSEDEDGVLSGWARDTVTHAAPALANRRCA